MYVFLLLRSGLSGCLLVFLCDWLRSTKSAVFLDFFDFCLFADLVWRVVYEEKGSKLDVEFIWSVVFEFCALLAPLNRLNT